jgi:hypothetical protein
MTITKPGIYFDYPAEEYFADPCPEPSLTQSIAKVLLDQSPLHAKTEHPRLTSRPAEDDDGKQTAAQAIGNACHRMMIGRGKEIAAGPWDDWRTKEARAFRSEQSKAGKCPVLQKHVDEAAMIAAAAQLQLTQCGWLDAFRGEGHGEVVLAWQEDGIWLRTLIDWLPSDMRTSYDLKTGGVSFAPHGIGKKMVDDGWDVQAAMHERALNALDPDNAGRRKFRFVALENSLPYAMAPVELDEYWMVMGRKKLDHAIAVWRECMRTGSFPGYGTEVITPEYPKWKEADWLLREIEHADRQRINPDLMFAG